MKRFEPAENFVTGQVAFLSSLLCARSVEDSSFLPHFGLNFDAVPAKTHGHVFFFVTTQFWYRVRVSSPSKKRNKSCQHAQFHPYLHPCNKCLQYLLTPQRSTFICLTPPQRRGPVVLPLCVLVHPLLGNLLPLNPPQTRPWRSDCFGFVITPFYFKNRSVGVPRS